MGKQKLRELGGLKWGSQALSRVLVGPVACVSALPLPACCHPLNGV